MLPWLGACLAAVGVAVLGGGWYGLVAGLIVVLPARRVLGRL